MCCPGNGLDGWVALGLMQDCMNTAEGSALVSRTSGCPFHVGINKQRAPSCGLASAMISALKSQGTDRDKMNRAGDPCWG